VPVGAFGSRLSATVAMLSGVYHRSKRMIARLLHDLFGISMAVGSVSACEQAVAQALALPVEAANAYAQRRPVTHCDETGWREARGRAGRWVLVTRQVTVFQLHQRRGAIAAWALLGQADGVLVSDRWTAYSGWPRRLRQRCWAHLKRPFEAFREWGGAIGPLGEALLRAVRELFARWHRVRDTLARSTFRVTLGPLRQRGVALFTAGAATPHKKAGICREILALQPARWTFVRVPGVEPTNNAAEQALRTAVIWRKICCGTHSTGGSRFVERMLTVSATLRQQGRHVHDYVTQACEAMLQDTPAPSLLPA